jgi:hypothetical protein
MSKHKTRRKPKTAPRQVVSGELTRRQVITTAMVSLGTGLAVKYAPDRVQTVRIEQAVPKNLAFHDSLQLQDEGHVQTLRQVDPLIIRWTFPRGSVANAV